MTRLTLRDLALLAVFPLLLTFLNDFWAFTSTQAGFIDPWLYVARFLHPQSHMLAFPEGYYGDRLPHLIPGALLYQTLGPIAGNYVLKVLRLCTVLFALYFLLCRLFDRRTALFCGVLISVHPYFLTALGWDYVSGTGLAFFALALILAVRAAQSERYRLGLFLTGACCVSLLSTHLLWVTLVWMVPMAYYLANRVGSRHPLGKPAAAFLLGSLATFCVYCGIYRAVTGHWFYLGNTVAEFQRVADTSALSWPVQRWIAHAHWLDQFICLLPISLCLLIRRDKSSAKTIASALFAAAFLGIWAANLAGFGFPAAQEYTSSLFPVYAIAIAAAVTDRISALGDAGYRLLVTATLVAGGTLIFADGPLRRLARPMDGFLEAHPFLKPLWDYQVLIVAALGLLFSIFLIARFVENGKALTLYVTGMLLMFSLQLTLARPIGWFSGTSGYSNKQGFQTILDADTWIHRHKPNRRLSLWLDKSEPRYGILTGLGSLYEWKYSLIGSDLPTLQPADLQRLAARTDVVCASWRAEKLQTARAALEDGGFTVAAWDETTVRDSGMELHLAFAHLKPVEPQGLNVVAGAMGIGSLTPVPSVTLHFGSMIHIISPKAQWAYAASIRIPDLKPSGAKMWIRISVRVLRGVAGFGVLDAKETDFYDRKFVEPWNQFEDILLEVSHPGESRKLIIQNASPDGVETELLVRQVELLTRPLH